MDKSGPETLSKPAPYQVLARKYRPYDFSTLIGQEPMVRTLTNAFRSGRIAQAWMLTGVRGVGKTTTARILARALNYKTASIDQPSVGLSETGEHCEAIMEGRHVDVIEMDAASHTGVDNMRDLLEQVRYSPVSARYKVYIIDEVHMLSGGAFNAMLKTLEEPPPHVKFIFATTEIRKVPITILSRCQRFDLRRIEPSMLTQHLNSIAERENVAVEGEALAMIARAAEGSVRDSLSILDQAIAHGSGGVKIDDVRDMLGLADRSRVIDLFEKLMKGDVPGALDELRAQYDAGADPSVILTELAEFNHLVTRLRFIPAGANDASLTADEAGRGLEYSKTLSVRVLSRTWQMLLKGIDEVQGSSRPVSAAEMVLIRIAHAASLPTLDDTLRRLEDEAPAGTSSPAAPAATGGGASGNGIGSGPARAAGQQVLQTGAGGGAPAMRLVQDQPEPEPAHPPADPAPQAAQQDEVPVASLSDIAALAEHHRDLQFKIMVRQYLRPVHIEPGRLEVSLTDDAPKSLIGDLGQRLKTWTGRRWVISVSRQEGGATLAEIEDRKRASAMDDARSDPTVAAIMNRFPGARIIDVRIPEAAAEPPVEADIDDEDGHDDI